MSAGRWVQLDGLRAIAVLAVILSHTGPPVLDRLGLGWHGVQLFFVLSGFLITGILLDARDTNTVRHTLRAFYARRFLRIFPAYYVVVAATALIGIPEVRQGLPWHLAYLSNWRAAHLGAWEGSTSHLWSLSVEEQFYLCWPLIILGCPMAGLPVLLAVAVLVGPLTRYLAIATGQGQFVALLPTPSNLDPLALGAGLAFIWRHAPHRRVGARRIALAGAVVALVAAPFLPPGNLALHLLGTALFFTWLVDRAAAGFSGVPNAILTSPPVVYLGTISYGLYLIHNFIGAAAWRVEQRFDVWMRVPSRGYGQFAYVFVATLILASLSWRYIERPLNNLKNRFPY
jgi:peptidoglycan/LPS O-acetylase OafA/YrhL